MKKHTGGNSPFAYIWKDSELVVEPSEAPVYALMFELFLVHQRKRTVAKILNEKGFRTRGGKEFTYSTIARLLQNPIAKGTRKFRLTSTDENGETIHEWVEENVEPIVTTELWDQVNSIIEEQGGKQTRKPKQDVFVGKVQCSCGSTMRIPSKSVQYICQDCDTAISREDLMYLFEDRLKLFPSPKAALLKSRINNIENSSANLTETKESKIRKVERDIEKLFELHSNSAITAETFKSRHKLLEEQLIQLKSTNDSGSNISYKKSDSLFDHWKLLDTESRYTFVDTLIQSVSIANKNVTFSLFSLFS